MTSRKGTRLTYLVIKDGYRDDYESSDIVYISTNDRTLVVKLDPSDGYRSYATQIDEYDEVDFFVKMSAPQEAENRVVIRYSKIEYNVRENIDYDSPKRKSYPTVAYDNADWIVRAWWWGKIVFELGTMNCDDYYPSYFLKAKGRKEFE